MTEKKYIKTALTRVESHSMKKVGDKYNCRCSCLTGLANECPRSDGTTLNSLGGMIGDRLV